MNKFPEISMFSRVVSTLSIPVVIVGAYIFMVYTMQWSNFFMVLVSFLIDLVCWLHHIPSACYFMQW